MSHGLTLIDFFMEHVSGRPNEVALRHKKFGIWREITWREYGEHVQAVHLALMELGLEPGDKVAFISDNRPEWVYWELGAMSARVVPFGIYPDNVNLDEISYLLSFSEAKLVLCEDQEQVDKILAITEKVPLIKRVIVIEEREVLEYANPLLLGYRDFLELGRGRSKKDPHQFERNIKKVKEDDVAFFSLTSGTTATPKLAMLSHQNLVTLSEIYREIDPTDSDFDFISFLPTAWIGERMTSVVRALEAGFKLNFPEGQETAMRDMREIGPNLIFSPPRLWQQMHADIEIKIAESSWLKRFIYGRSIKTALLIGAKKNDRIALSPWDKIRYWLCNVLVLRKIKDHLGLSRIRYLYTGGAPMGADLFLFFYSIGVRIKQAYGLTESGALAALQRDDDIRLETVGPAAPGVDIRISEEGEILIQGPNVFKGYFKQPEETEKALRDGWLWTGDKGYLDQDNHLVMIDRFGEVMKLADGNEFSPQYIENKLRFSLYINEAIVIGHEQDYVVTLIQINMDTVGKWAEDEDLSYTTFKDLVKKPEVFELIKGEVAWANKSLPEIATIKRFQLLEKELDPEGGELTQTNKIRRSFVMQKHKQEIDQLYSD
ncbi:MAG: AMP-binding protein [Deltaproteobacteria bacterium]|nr:AMP-binding protein [Deltaproteobacteria bacterium]